MAKGSKPSQQSSNSGGKYGVKGVATGKNPSTGVFKTGKSQRGK